MINDCVIFHSSPASSSSFSSSFPLFFHFFTLDCAKRNSSSTHALAHQSDESSQPDIPQMPRFLLYLWLHLLMDLNIISRFNRMKSHERVRRGRRSALKLMTCVCGGGDDMKKLFIFYFFYTFFLFPLSHWHESEVSAEREFFTRASAADSLAHKWMNQMNKKCA